MLRLGNTLASLRRTLVACVRLPHRIGDLAIRARLRRPSQPTRVVFVYFSYAGDFSILRMSLASLMHCAPENVKSVVIGVDPKGPFSTQQQTELERIVPGITFQLLPVYHGGWGADSVLAQCREYARIASAEECDYVAKVDSDVLFLPGQEFSLLASSRADAFGDGHYDGNRHFQGGLYFLSRQCCLRLHDLDHDCVTSFITAGQGKFLPGEDAVIFHLLKSKDIKIWLTYYMLFPAEYARRRLPQEGFFPRRPASALHFIGHKADMPGYFQAIFPTLQPK